jgi:hypothetical protein
MNDRPLNLHAPCHWKMPRQKIVVGADGKQYWTRVKEATEFDIWCPICQCWSIACKGYLEDGNVELEVQHG